MTSRFMDHTLHLAISRALGLWPVGDELPSRTAEALEVPPRDYTSALSRCHGVYIPQRLEVAMAHAGLEVIRYPDAGVVVVRKR